jgi:hypothetical protein
MDDFRLLVVMRRVIAKMMRGNRETVWSFSTLCQVLSQSQRQDNLESTVLYQYLKVSYHIISYHIISYHLKLEDKVNT